MEEGFRFVRQIPEKFLAVKPELKVQLEELETLVKFQRDVQVVMRSALEPQEKVAEIDKLLLTVSSSDALQSQQIVAASNGEAATDPATIATEPNKMAILSSLSTGCKSAKAPSSDADIPATNLNGDRDSSTATESSRWIHFKRCRSLLNQNYL